MMSHLLIDILCKFTEMSLVNILHRGLFPLEYFPPAPSPGSTSLNYREKGVIASKKTSL